MPSKKQIRDALRLRIIEDDQHGFFDEDTWLDTTFGLFYDDDEEFIDKAVFEVTEHLVQGEGRTLPDNAAAQLEGDVNADNTPVEAIDPMFIAAGKAVALNKVARSPAGKSKAASGPGKSTGGRKGKASVGAGKASGASGKSADTKSEVSGAKSRASSGKGGK